MQFRERKLNELVAEPPRNGIYKPKEYIGQGIKLIRMGELFRLGEISPLNADYQLIDVTAKEAEKLKLKNGDLLFSRTSVVADGVGKCSILRDVNQDIIFDSNIIRIRPDSKKVSSKFLYYYFNSELGRSKVKSLSSGAAVTTVTGFGLLGLRVPYPSMEEQYRIVQVLSNYDDLIENNNRRIAILEEMAQSLYREWFVNFRFPGHENAKFIDSPLGKIPEGWEVVPVGELISFDIGGGWGKEKSDQKHIKPAYVIRGTDLKSVWSGDIDQLPFRYHTESNLKNRRLNEGDIVFEVSGGSKDQPVGRALIVTKELLKYLDDDVICASFCKLIKPQNEACAQLLLRHIHHIYENRSILKYQVQSTGISNFKFKVFLENELVIKPNDDLLSQFLAISDSVVEMCQKLAFTNRNLKKQRGLLLPKLISGKISISWT